MPSSALPPPTPAAPPPMQPHPQPPPRDLLAAYLRALGASPGRPITRILIANNGIGAVKAIRSLRAWAYDTFSSTKVLSLVLLATPDDIKVNAEAIRMADTLVPVPGGSNIHNYANVALIVDVAERYNCDAVWAGWGHASENPLLPEGLAARGVAFLGPDPGPMAALGDKVASTLIAQAAGVPVVAWSGDELRSVEYDPGLGGVDPVAFQKACVSTEAEARASGERIGYPVMIKASEGGGGKGIRLVKDPDNVEAAFRQVQGEVPASPIFIMAMVEDARHLEVQLIADRHGSAIALYGRECSIQRRHQKIIEEGPVVAAPVHVWKELEDAAVRLAKAVGYSGAGTVEYLYRGDETGGEFYFLELNPRLQVEHPVTEWITGLNLPALQLNVAMGVPLNKIPAIRRFYECSKSSLQLDSDTFEDLQEDIFAAEPLDLNVAKRRPPKGHVIACRITAENSDEGFQPTSGSVHELTFRNSPDVWGYFSVGTHGGVHEFADSQFGHLFAWGETRDASRRSMVMALSGLSIRGEIRTTVEYLLKLLELPDFKKNNVSTRWLDRLISEKMTPERPRTQLAVVVGAVCKAHHTFVDRRADFLASLERGQLPALSSALTSFSGELIYEDLKYAFAVSLAGPSTYKIQVNSSTVLVEVTDLADGGLLLLLDGRSHVAYAKDETTGLRLSLDGKTCVFPKEYDPSRLVSSATGKLVRYLVEDGATLRKGDSYAELEVMKMYLALTVPEGGRVSLLKPTNSAVDLGEQIGSLDLDDPSKVRRAKIFRGSLGEFQAPHQIGHRPHEILNHLVSEAKLLLAGFDAGKDVWPRILTLCGSSEVIAGELEAALQRTTGGLDADVAQSVADAVKILRLSKTFPASELACILSTVDATIRKSSKFSANCPVATITALYLASPPVISILNTLLADYITTEKVFASSTRRPEDVLFEMRDNHRHDLGTVLALATSHFGLLAKNRFILQLLTYISSAPDVARVPMIKAQLHELSLFNTTAHADLSLRTRLILAELERPKFSQRMMEMDQRLDALVGATTPEERQRPMNAFVAVKESILDVLISVILPGDEEGFSVERRLAAVEVVIQRAYRAYAVKDLNLFAASDALHATWNFRFLQPEEQELKPYASILRSKPKMSVISYDSADNLNLADTIVDEIVPFRMGRLIVFDSWAGLLNGFDNAVETYARSVVEEVGLPESLVNVLYVVVRRDGEGAPSESAISSELESFCQQDEASKRLLLQGGVKTVTFIVSPEGSEDSYPGFYTLRPAMDFREDLIYRNIDPPMAFQLELSRLALFDIERVSHPNRSLYVFYAKAKATGSTNRDDDTRFFVRAVIRHADVFSSSSEVVVSIPEVERAFCEALDAVEIGRCDRKYGTTDFNHVFLNILPVLDIDVDDVDAICRRMFQRYASRCWLLRVFSVELRTVLPGLNRDGLTRTLRFLLFNPSGHMLRVEGYSEEQDHVSGQIRLVSIDRDNRGHLHGALTQEPYPTMDRMQRRRVVAQALETTYVYDFKHLFSKQLHEKWRKYSQSRLLGGFKRNKIPVKLLTVKEIILKEGDDNEVVETNRNPGQNTIGMVAWKFELFTPECSSGRTLIVIANDITFMSGSFGPQEDALFAAASRLARREGLPRIYLAANSGARIGLAEEVRRSFDVEWNDPEDPTKGFKNLTLNNNEDSSIHESVELNHEECVTASASSRKIESIIGSAHGLGVENLMGSGLIAGETSAAYEEIFTLTYVSARSVGIGAYLVRLGQRVIQKETGAPILLTGFSALNKVLGHQVYMSNEQLGGVKVMYPNGVTHQTVRDDLQGIDAILTWLGYVPKKRGERLPVVESMDPINRTSLYLPKSAIYDPRELIRGPAAAADSLLGGLFDRGSWQESLGLWARTVVTGRARLGGIPVGVVTSEIRPVERVIPADPALPETHEIRVSQAGQVWYPDSAAKTAQAIRDMGREGLPLFILANWRGFSGGMRDMYDEILKTGSEIVDALREYKQPVFVYIPPGGELRGGAWVVVDTLINPNCIEMYADPTSRGGVLEPEGVVDVKYRRRDLIKTMHRLDDRLREMDLKLGDQTSGSPVLTEDSKRDLTEQIIARETELMPVYQQIATTFADLHDTPSRMIRKGAVRKIVAWDEARIFFYWRLQRRLAEFRVSAACRKADPSLTQDAAFALLKRWFEQHLHSSDADRGVPASSNGSIGESSVNESPEHNSDDQAVYQWLEEEEEESIAKRISRLRDDSVACQVKDLHLTHAEGLLRGLESIVSTLPNDAAAGEFVSSLSARLTAANNKRTMSTAQSSLATSLLNRLRRTTLAPSGTTSSVSTQETPPKTQQSNGDAKSTD